jgi:Tol biopolymer transport system component
LEREKGRRFESASDVRILLEEPLPTVSVQDKSTLCQIPYLYVIAIIFFSLLIGAGVAYLWQRSPADSSLRMGPIKAYIMPPEGTVSAFHRGFALSPDGKTLVFSARSKDGHRQLWKRQLNQTHSQPIAGTDNGTHPFWSPDGENIAFFVPGELRRVPVNGGNIEIICTHSGLLHSGSWGDNNIVLFTGDPAGRRVIYMVPANGGTPAPVQKLFDSDSYNAQWLPDGIHFLFYRVEENNSCHIFVTSLDDTMPLKSVIKLNQGGQSFFPGFFFSPPDYLFYNQTGALKLQRFDMGTLSLVGPAVSLAGLVGSPLEWFSLTASHDRVVMLAQESTDDIGNPGDPLARFTWLNRQGDIVGTLGPIGRYWTLRLSHDGLKVAANPDEDIWIYNANSHSERITSNPATDLLPIWAPDDEKIAFTRIAFPIIRAASQEGEEETLIADDNRPFWATDWSHDDRYIIGFSQSKEINAGYDIWFYDFEEKSVEPWLETEFNETQARFSPNGEWVAYASDRGGSFEIFLRSFKKKGNPIPVSSNGGMHPSWSAGGQELFYLKANDELMVVDVSKLYSKEEIGVPKSLFKVTMNDLSSRFASPYDVSPDGNKFLVNMPEPPEPLLFIQGLEELLEEGK